MWGFNFRLQVLLLIAASCLPPPSVFLPAGLIISLQLLRGDMEQVRRENPLIFTRGVAITRKLGFPDVIMPGESATCNSSRHEEICLWDESESKFNARKSRAVERLLASICIFPLTVYGR